MYMASIFGPFLAVLGLWMLLFAENLMKVWIAIKTAPHIFYMGSAITLLLGIFILDQYNVWEWDALVFVTLLGWIMVLRGVMGLFMPQLLIKLTMSSHRFMKIMGVIPLVWGLVLCWVAFLG